MQNESQWHNDKGRAKTSLKKYLPLTLFVTFACERELETEQNWNIWPPLLWPLALCLSRSPGLLNRRPRGPLCWLSDTPYQQILWTPTQSGALSPFGLVWLSLPHLVYNSVRPLTATLTSVLTELYNSSTSTQSPTRSLEWYDWSPSSGNNCHAVHSSLSSGASVYECTMGISFSSSHFISQFPPTRFPLITAIRMYHLLPVHHLGMAFLAGSKAKIQHSIY